MKHMQSVLTAILFALLAALLPARAESPQCIIFLGDSITFDGRWATRVEAALRNVPEYRDAGIINLGLPSETVSGLSEPNHAGGRFSASSAKSVG